MATKEAKFLAKKRKSESPVHFIGKRTKDGWLKARVYKNWWTGLWTVEIDGVDYDSSKSLTSAINNMKKAGFKKINYRK